MLTHLPHSEQFTERRLAVLTVTKLTEELNEHVRLQLVESPARTVQRGDIRSPDGATAKENSNGSSPTRRLLR
jgi:hypothetical protein